MFRDYVRHIIVFCVFVHCLFLSNINAQETNCRVSGRVVTADDESVEGASIKLIHEPTQTEYALTSRKNGYFDYFNVNAGGPYTVQITAIGFEKFEKQELYIHFSGEFFLSDDKLVIEYVLTRHLLQLAEITVKARHTSSKINIDLPLLQSMPSISRNFQDYIRLIPQARVTGDGVMSLAGQNNRFNSFFIDGANNTDMRGLAVNGMNGGQTGSPPISIEALEEVNVLLNPYNVQYGNFTGGSINAITKSGTNEFKASAWYYFRNEYMAGRSPQFIEKPNSPGELYRPRLTSFLNNTMGSYTSGAMIKNKLFYFILLERQTESRPQPFNFDTYRGNTNQQQLMILSDFLKTNYQYDPGSFLLSRDDLNATRINLKLDWNVSFSDKFMFSYRFNDAERTSAPRPSSTNAISFQNSGVILPARTHSLSFEWKHTLKNQATNRFLLTFTNQLDYRKFIGQPFPNVVILDGNATLNFGSEASSGPNYFKGNEINFVDAITFTRKKRILSVGTDVDLTNIKWAALPALFGAYQFRSLNDFLNNVAPSRLQRFFYFDDNKKPEFSSLRSSFFVNEEMRPNTRLKFNFGVRLDMNTIISKPATDHFFNDTARLIISDYYNIDKAQSGKVMRPQWTLSPRVGVEYKLPNMDLLLKSGAGLFLGHIVNTWIWDVFNSNTGGFDIVPQSFIADPYSQPTPQSLNMNPNDLKGTLILMDRHFKYPSIFRTSFTIEKKIKSGLVISIESILTKNINEVTFKNINILPPLGRSSIPDSRNIYSFNTNPNKIDLQNSAVKNPYTGIYLITNNNDKKGFAYSVSFSIAKKFSNFYVNSSYTYGNSKVLFEVTGPQTPASSQWRNMETINGRNYTSLSISDNDLKHRVTAWITKKIIYSHQRINTSLSIFYNGQSGTPYSYVYVNSMINDNGRRNENFDLIYIPSASDLSSMNFLPITNSGGQVLFTTDQQKNELNEFIEGDKYLKKHRGEFSERNGARLPFTNTIDIRIQQDFTLKRKYKKINLSIIYDVFNFTNMLNRKWGRTWFLLNDSYPLITFVNWQNTTTSIPQYQFTPLTGKPYGLQTSTLPGNSARWISQLGIRITMN